MFTYLVFLVVLLLLLFFFFFQAEDGIRDWSVTGVQTCALPISERAGDALRHEEHSRLHAPVRAVGGHGLRAHVRVARVPARHRAWACDADANRRSEERRVGKECGSRWSPQHWKERQRSSRRQSR